MLAISSAALEQLKGYLDDQLINSAIRITLMKGSCAGRNLRFTVDEARGNDYIIKQDGIQFLLDKRLAADCGLITIDFDERFDHCPCCGRDGGFRFSSENTACCEDGCCASCCPNGCQFAGSEGCLIQEDCKA
ncbi:IscA/HesB family protein [Candidatus Electronema sp. PJ]|uniref:IscA/HesB family protein n=1 Tax=Candidatus Electronema sp. PJ TaxID=3401572 RepID=UPI003AA9239B